jgi:hypothetical protein
VTELPESEAGICSHDTLRNATNLSNAHAGFENMPNANSQIHMRQHKDNFIKDQASYMTAFD